MVKARASRVAMVGAVPVKVKLPEVVALPVSAATWNLALEVAVPPMARSSVMLVGERTPSSLCHQPWTPEVAGVVMLPLQGEVEVDMVEVEIVPGQSRSAQIVGSRRADGDEVGIQSHSARKGNVVRYGVPQADIAIGQQSPGKGSGVGVESSGGVKVVGVGSAHRQTLGKTQVVGHPGQGIAVGQSQTPGSG